MSDDRMRSKERAGIRAVRDLVRLGRFEELTLDELAEQRLVSPERLAIAEAVRTAEWSGAIIRRKAIRALSMSEAVNYAVDAVVRVLPIWNVYDAADQRPRSAIVAARTGVRSDSITDGAAWAARAASAAACVDDKAVTFKARAAAYAAKAAHSAGLAVAYADGPYADVSVFVTVDLAVANAARAAYFNDRHGEVNWQRDRLRRYLLSPVPPAPINP